MKYIDIPPDLREYVDQVDTYPELQRRVYEENTCTCIYCGTPGLYWAKSLPGKWGLYKYGELHRCAAYRRSKYG